MIKTLSSAEWDRLEAEGQVTALTISPKQPWLAIGEPGRPLRQASAQELERYLGEVRRHQGEIAYQRWRAQLLTLPPRK